MAKKSYKGTLNYDLLRIEHQQQVKKINDMYIEVVMSVRGLTNLHAEYSAAETDSIYITVPTSKGKTARITRKREDVLSLLEARRNRREYVQSLVFAVSLTEEYVSRNLVRIIRAYPQKVLVSPKGGAASERSINIDIKELIDIGSYSDAIAKKASERVREAMYATPAKYAEYAQAIFGFAYPEATWNRFIEVKATRDLHVHGDGTINEIYLSKVGDLARGTIGELATVDAPYIEAAVSCMKQVFSQTYTGLRERYADSTKLLDVFSQEMVAPF